MIKISRKLERTIYITLFCICGLFIFSSWRNVGFEPKVQYEVLNVDRQKYLVVMGVGNNSTSVAVTKMD
ncbi:MAG: hypothetical protein LBC49_02725 [Bacteroidales bacterium]|jgi:hypothetical protein|nr:hypothetical protein [Bacteroidales bacterium]